MDSFVAVRVKMWQTDDKKFTVYFYYQIYQPLTTSIVQTCDIGRTRSSGRSIIHRNSLPLHLRDSELAVSEFRRLSSFELSPDICKRRRTRCSVTTAPDDGSRMLEKLSLQQALEGAQRQFGGS